MRYVHADIAIPGVFELRMTDEPVQGRSEALVAVRAFSLNAGEVRWAMAGKLSRPGWDLAGEVLAPALSGGGPAKGDRVVGWLPSGAWAERVVVPLRALAPIPEGVSFEQAACLPVAGVTALNMLARAGQIAGRNVLVNGASGGVGYFACALASLSGAQVTGVVRNQEKIPFAKGAGAGQVVVSETLDEAAAGAPYDLIVDTVGGKPLERAVEQLAANGLYIACMTRGPVTLHDPDALMAKNARIAFYGGFVETKWIPQSDSLARLLACMADGSLKAPVEETHGWENIAQACARLANRQVSGKIVMTVE